MLPPVQPSISRGTGKKSEAISQSSMTEGVEQDHPKVAVNEPQLAGHGYVAQDEQVYYGATVDFATRYVNIISLTPSYRTSVLGPFLPDGCSIVIR
jgi:hypothetical protein